MTIADNLNNIHERIDAAATRCGRSTGDVQLITVSKHQPLEALQAAYDAGERQFGESRPQALSERLIHDIPGADWHFIGPLQKNKVKSVVASGAAIHSVHDLALLQRINRIATELDKTPEVLLQINVSGEASKQGFSATELPEVLPQLSELNHVTCIGLMTMAPYGAPEPELRKIFGMLRKLAESATQAGTPLPHLSMGMSGDFEIAIEEGATMIRVGTGIFGARAH